MSEPQDATSESPCHMFVRAVGIASRRSELIGSPVFSSKPQVPASI